MDVRVSVFVRTAIHAPGGWALIENLPNVHVGDPDQVGVELSTTGIPSPEDKSIGLSLRGLPCDWVARVGSFLLVTKLCRLAG